MRRAVTSSFSSAASTPTSSFSRTIRIHAPPVLPRPISSKVDRIGALRAIAQQLGVEVPFPLRRQGVVVALCGVGSAGKSTFLNYLFHECVGHVSEEHVHRWPSAYCWSGVPAEVEQDLLESQRLSLTTDPSHVHQLNEERLYCACTKTVDPPLHLPPHTVVVDTAGFSDWTMSPQHRETYCKLQKRIMSTANVVLCFVPASHIPSAHHHDLCGIEPSFLEMLRERLRDPMSGPRVIVVLSRCDELDVTEGTTQEYVKLLETKIVEGTDIPRDGLKIRPLSLKGSKVRGGALLCGEGKPIGADALVREIKQMSTALNAEELVSFAQSLLRLSDFYVNPKHPWRVQELTKSVQQTSKNALTLGSLAVGVAGAIVACTPVGVALAASVGVCGYLGLAAFGGFLRSKEQFAYLQEAIQDSQSLVMDALAAQMYQRATAQAPPEISAATHHRNISELRDIIASLQ